MLVRANHGAVDMMERPVKLPRGVCLLLEVCQDAVPDAGTSPAIEAGRDRRIPDTEALASEIAAGEQDRNATATMVNWRFTTEDARIKLKRLYPSHGSRGLFRVWAPHR